MVSLKDTKEVGNRSHCTHRGICVAFHLRFASEKEWRVLISVPIRFFLNLSIEMKGHVAMLARQWEKKEECQQNLKAVRQGLKCDAKIIKLQTQIRNAANQNQKQVRLWLSRMQRKVSHDSEKF